MRIGLAGIAVLVMILTAQSSCSLVFMERGQRKAEAGMPGSSASARCTKDDDTAWWDVVIVGVDGIIGTAATLTAFTDDSASTGGRLTVGVIFLGLAAAHGYSALKGFQWAKECRSKE